LVLDGLRQGAPADHPDAQLPEFVWLLLRTRQVNRWLGTGLTMDEIAEWPPLAWELFDATVAAVKEGS